MKRNQIFRRFTLHNHLNNLLKLFAYFRKSRSACNSILSAISWVFTFSCANITADITKTLFLVSLLCTLIYENSCTFLGLLNLLWCEKKYKINTWILVSLNISPFALNGWSAQDRKPNQVWIRVNFPVKQTVFSEKTYAEHSVKTIQLRSAKAEKHSLANFTI